MAKRVLLAGLFHETHSFLKERTPWDAFSIRRGTDLLAARGDGSPLAGALEIADEVGWDVIPTIDARATPSGLVTDDVLDRFWSKLRDVAEPEMARGVDGLCLILHGAMITESCLDVEGELVRRLRRLPGGDRVPIGGVLDLHGNISREFAESTQAFVAYRQNPHVDACDAARDGARLLHRAMLSPRSPVTVFAAPRLVWPPTGTGTADDPMRTLESLARDIERHCPDIAAVNVFAGFGFGDSPDTGVSFTAVTFGDPAEARRELQSLCDEARRLRHEGNVVPPSLDDVMPNVRGEVERGETPVILVEPSDNVGGGAPGDATHVLRALLANRINNAAVVINDPQAVAEVSQWPLGQVAPLTFGGRADSRFDSPVTCEAKLLSVSDGRFTLEDRNSHLASMCGERIDMGQCAVIQHAGITVLLTSRKTPPFDLGQLRSQGIEPERLAVIGVKAAVAHRRAYDPITRHTHTVDTPGPCTSNLAALPFQHVTIS